MVYSKISKIDWNTVWKDLYENNVDCRGCYECASIWASREKARAYLERFRDNPERICKVLDGFPLGAGSTVLDIGAGPGTLAVPLAGRVARVTAVEPAAGMADVMIEHAAEVGVSNLAVVRKRWEDVDPAIDLDGPYDLVLASYSLGMKDIKKAIGAMCEASSGRVYLFWFAGMTAWDRAKTELWPKLHGMEYRPGPMADILFNVLYSMGIYPNVETSRIEQVRRFSNIDAAMDEFREQYRVKSPAQEDILREYLSATLSENEDGFLHSGVTTQVKFWWAVDRCQ